ncbi:MAG TPA: hypothetical protein VGX49_09335 [Jatrophihabitans sp.]|jgi:hypothetical protein|nr:hypothetical protein [Jatrophihabitans sp.]
MVRHRRNNALAGIVMLNGVLVMAVGSTMPWGEFEVGGLNQPTLPYQGRHVFGFDQTITSTGSVSDFHPAILIISGVVALCALALFATRVRGLGALWRVIALGSLVPVALVIGSLWSVFDDDPGTELEATNSAPVRAFGLAMRTNAVTSSIGPGLFALTIGGAVAVLGALIPAFRSKQVIGEPKQPPSHGDFLTPEASRAR